MAHSLHSLVLDVCCENSQFYSSKEEALKVLYASVFIITTIWCRYFYFVTQCYTTSVLSHQSSQEDDVMASDTGSYSLLTADLSLPSLKTLFYRRLVWPRGSSSCVTRSHPSRTASCSSTTSATSPSQVRVYLPTLPTLEPKPSFRYHSTISILGRLHQTMPP